MRSHLNRARSGPHSIHDARQHARALLIFGPGAPAPRQRPHPGLLPDVAEPARPARRRSILARFIARLRRSPSPEPAEATLEGVDVGGHSTDAKQMIQEKDRLAA